MVLTFWKLRKDRCGLDRLDPFLTDLTDLTDRSGYPTLPPTEGESPESATNRPTTPHAPPPPWTTTRDVDGDIEISLLTVFHRLSVHIRSMLLDDLATNRLGEHVGQVVCSIDMRYNDFACILALAHEVVA